jgi:hypothetical protein
MNDPVPTDLPGISVLNLPVKDSSYTLRFLIEDNLRKLFDSDTHPRFFFQSGGLYSFKAGTVLAQVIYEDKNGESRLCFLFGRKIFDDAEKFDENDKLPRTLSRQTWQIEYPLCAYRTGDASQQKAVFFNMRQKADPILIDLTSAHKKFISFVNSDLFKNQTYLKKSSESMTTCLLLLLQDEYDDLLELHIMILH